MFYLGHLSPQELKNNQRDRPLHRKYPMKKVIVGGVNIQLQMDLVDMQQWERRK